MRKTLTPGLWEMLDAIPELDRWPSPEDTEVKLEEWKKANVQLIDLGSSRAGRTIRAAVFPLGASPTRTMLAWGYPHPEEPIGAAGLMALGDAALRGQLTELSDWKMVLILCADQDEARKQLWLLPPKTAKDFVDSAWRPTRLGIEVDYGFPIDWGPFYQPANSEGLCHTTEECKELHDGPPCLYEDWPPKPLSESLALARGIDLFKPEVIAAMHSTHTGGDYTFLLERESPEVFSDMFEIPAEAGSCRHLGEPLDRGKRWKRAEPDLLKEPNLNDRKAFLSRLPGYEEGQRYAGNGTAGQYIESMNWKAQFICPETALFRDPVFSDRSETEQKVVVREAAEDRKDKRYRVVRFSNNGEWIVAHQERIGDKETVIEKEGEILAPRSLLGVRALLRRRRAMHAADLIWEEVKQLPDLRYHPYLDERAKISVPGRYVGDRSMLIFRAREDYRNTATKAQEATFAWQYPMQTATLLGNLQNFLHHQDRDRPEIIEASKKIARIQDAELAAVPDSLLTEAKYAPSMRSQLARVLRLMLVEPRNNG